MMSIILINWNGWADTIACIQSLLNSSSTDARIIVVDNNSSDESLVALKSWAEGGLELLGCNGDVERLAFEGRLKRRHCSFIQYKPVVHDFIGLEVESNADEDTRIHIYFVSVDHNGGFGYGCNVGMRLGEKLNSHAYWLLNNDCVVKPDSLGLVFKKIEANPLVIFGTILRFYFCPDVIQAVGGGFCSSITGRVQTATSLDKNYPLNFINGASMIISAKCFRMVGGFDEAIFMYFEEIDFCIRAAAVGYSFDVIRTDVFHKHGGSQGKVSSVGAWRNALVNQNYVLYKHIGCGSWIVFFYLKLLLRCFIPRGEKNARIGARQALKQLVFGRAKA